MTSTVLSKSIDPFFSTKGSAEGHGLGLSMVFGFVKQSNGHMTIDSVLEQGTRVSLYLPHYEGDRSHAVKTQDQTDKSTLPQGHGETILLIEDDPAVQNMIRKSLEFLQYEPVCVSSGEEAIAYLKEVSGSVDLVVTDIVLARGMNGFELSNTLASDFPDIKLIYISGYSQDAETSMIKTQAPVDILQKPFSLAKLARYIAEQL